MLVHGEEAAAVGLSEEGGLGGEVAGQVGQVRGGAQHGLVGDDGMEGVEEGGGGAVPGDEEIVRGVAGGDGAMGGVLGDDEAVGGVLCDKEVMGGVPGNEEAMGASSATKKSWGCPW